MATTYHVEGGQTALINGPAKFSLVADEPPIMAAAEPPTVTALNPPSALAGDATDIQLLVDGTGFNEISKIVFNGNDEPTTLMSPTQVRTIVKPSLFTVAADVPVAVRNGTLVSNEQTFSFTDTMARAGAKTRR
jgi:hypothetical protein